MNLYQLAPDEPLSPELVLVLPPEPRARVLARLGAPVWPAPRLRVVEVAAPPAKPLALVFVLVTTATLAMALVAHAVR